MTQLRRNVRESRAGVVGVLVAVAGWGAPAASAAQFQHAAAPGEVREVTFSRDVAPILQQNCQMCHQPGSIGPMSLMTYEEVRPWAPLIKVRVEERAMPPYHYDTGVGIQELITDRRLSEKQIATIAAWVDAGAPLGNPADLPPPVQWPDASVFRLAGELGPPDIIVESDPYAVPESGMDVWWNPLTPLNLPQDRCIKAIEVKPSVPGRKLTHHVVASLQVQDAEGEWVGAGSLTEYAVGKLGELVPSDVCRTFPATSQVSWSIHYQPQGVAIEKDVVDLGLWFYPEDHQPKYRQTLAQYQLFDGGSGTLAIPPHGKIMMQGTFTFDTPVRIDSFMPHMHLRGTAMLMETMDPKSRRRQTLSRVSNWHPGWQLNHIYEEDAAPLLPAGQLLILTAWYDNTENNPHNPDPDQWVSRGARTVDEMSKAWIAVTHLDQEGYERLLQERSRDMMSQASAQD